MENIKENCHRKNEQEVATNVFKSGVNLADEGRAACQTQCSARALRHKTI